MKIKKKKTKPKKGERLSILVFVFSYRTKGNRPYEFSMLFTCIETIETVMSLFSCHKDSILSVEVQSRGK